MTARYHSQDTINEIYSLRGLKSAALIGREFGLSRSAVIGLWHRERHRRGDKVILSTQQCIQHPRHFSNNPRRVGISFRPRPIKIKTPEEIEAKRLRDNERRREKDRERRKAEFMAGTLSAPESRRLSITDLGYGQCKYPDGDGPFFFCGNPQDADSSYCPYHHHLTLRAA